MSETSYPEEKEALKMQRNGQYGHGALGPCALLPRALLFALFLALAGGCALTDGKAIGIEARQYQFQHSPPSNPGTE
ncbi:MAG: hypothetical protein LBU39_08560 [Desulfobulbaceae bacterium]|jgi:hypothetical protein|nr:hypothetical protein [Desulfobulbaceae bacterium]